jgi:hypothetical protein
MVLAYASLIALAGPAFAVEPISDEDGWSGYVWFGAGYTELTNNEVAGHKGIDTARGTISSIDAGPPSDDDFHPVFAGEANYTWADSGTEFFLGTAAETLINLDLAQQMGVRRDFGDLGLMQASVVFSSVPAEVWEDPFAEDEPRVGTDRDSRGIRFQWDKILGSNFEIRLSRRRIDIDPERSGDFLVAEGRLDPADQGLLDRNGDDTQFRLLHKWWYAPGQRLDMQYVYKNHDRDGNAVAGDSHDVQLTWLLTDGRTALVLNGWLGVRDYDQANPIYGRKTDKDTYGIAGLYVHPLPWKGGRWSWTTLVLWDEEVSDVAFYDSKILSVMTGLVYRFGNLPTHAQPQEME